MQQRLHPYWIVGVVVLSIFAMYRPSTIPPAFATHEIDHRFTVHGTVRDGRTFPGRPLAGAEVVVRDSKSGEVLQRGVTDQRGQFSLILHLHNEDRGKFLTVQCQSAEKTLELQFDPDNRTAERQAKVDLVVLAK
jgi:hypothetical protein